MSWELFDILSELSMTDLFWCSFGAFLSEPKAGRYLVSVVSFWWLVDAWLSGYFESDRGRLTSILIFWRHLGLDYFEFWRGHFHCLIIERIVECSQALSIVYWLSELTATIRIPLHITGAYIVFDLLKVTRSISIEVMNLRFSVILILCHFSLDDIKSLAYR